jgi:putative membrane protein
MLIRLLIRWFIMALSLLIVAYLIPGFSVTTPVAAFIAAVVFGLVNGTIGTILKIVTFPITLVTLGLFWLVINAAMLGLTAYLVNGFAIDTPVTAFFGSIVLSIVNLILRTVLPDGSKKEVKD